MKEITSEKYTKKADNIFALVVMAAKRATSLSRGAKSLIPESKHSKASIIALEEIVEDKIKLAAKPAPESDDKKKK